MIIVDTGPLVAVANDRDKWHAACVACLGSARGPLLVPSPVMTEVCYMLSTRRGPQLEAAFLEDISEGVLELAELTTSDIRRMAELVRKYASLPLGVADASVVALAERMNISTIATIDRRDFSIVRPRHIGAFTIVP